MVTHHGTVYLLAGRVRSTITLQVGSGESTQSCIVIPTLYVPICSIIRLSRLVSTLFHTSKLMRATNVSGAILCQGISLIINQYVPPPVYLDSHSSIDADAHLRGRSHDRGCYVLSNNLRQRQDDGLRRHRSYRVPSIISFPRKFLWLHAPSTSECRSSRCLFGHPALCISFHLLFLLYLTPSSIVYKVITSMTTTQHSDASKSSSITPLYPPYSSLSGPP